MWEGRDNKVHLVGYVEITIFIWTGTYYVIKVFSETKIALNAVSHLPGVKSYKPHLVKKQTILQTL